MGDSVNALCILAGACFAMMAIGASFTFGIATVCRRMKWAPINIIVNLNDYTDVPSTPAEQPQGGEGAPDHGLKER